MLSRLAVVLAMVLVGGCGAVAPSTPAAAPVTITVAEHQPVRSEVLSTLIPGFEAEMAASGRPVPAMLS